MGLCAWERAGVWVRAAGRGDPAPTVLVLVPVGNQARENALKNEPYPLELHPQSFRVSRGRVSRPVCAWGHAGMWVRAAGRGEPGHTGLDLVPVGNRARENSLKNELILQSICREMCYNGRNTAIII